MTITNKCQGTIHTCKVEFVAPSPQLQALIDKANDKRSAWTKTKDFFSSAWDGTKRVAQASWDDPGNTGIGVAKGVGNLPSDLWNLLVLGSKYSGPIPQALQADALNYGALQAYQGGDTATANAMAGRASEMMSAGYASDIFEIKGDAQQGGSVLSMLIPVGAVAKGAGTAAKVVRGGNALDTAADAAKVGNAADGVAIVAKVKSLRQRYLGSTPGKGSKTGREVQDRMRAEGKLRENAVTGKTEFQASNGTWYDISKADMAHKTDAVTWWNNTGRQYGAKAPEVRTWMLDSRNYYLELNSINRSQGAILGQTTRYLPPLK